MKMKHTALKSILSLTMASSLTAGLIWSNNSYACAPDAYISAVCIMATPSQQYLGGWGNQYLPAKGQMLQVNQYQALFALLGTTYGGDGKTTFGLPDLQGRVVLGAGNYTDSSGTVTYAAGSKGGNRTIALTAQQVPVAPHFHTLSAGSGGVVATATAGSLALDFSKVTFNTSLAGVSAATSLNGVTATADGSALTLYASSGGTLTAAPYNSSLGSPSVSNKIYSNATPYVAMIGGTNGSIRGTAPVTFTGSPTTTLNGNPATTMNGSPGITGAPNVTVSGQTNSAATAQAASPVNILPPYVAMTYFIAYTGTWPTPNN